MSELRELRETQAALTLSQKVLNAVAKDHRGLEVIRQIVNEMTPDVVAIMGFDRFMTNDDIVSMFEEYTDLEKVVDFNLYRAERMTPAQLADWASRLRKVKLERDE